ncbi:MAG TPA: lipid-A-disaccharide synthase [Terriglobales bacterium]|nr:lipid-A-disaccharide synthase [Terriglobales bacterium]
MDLMFVAGEASGDAHAAELISELRGRHPNLRFFGCGGPQMAAAGCELLVSTDDLAVMGLVEVLRHLPRLHALLRRLRRALRDRRPAAVILVDFPDFNLRLAASARAAGIPAIYFISPQLWAWRSGRVREVRRNVRRMICIFPFEPAFYAQHGIEVAHVGHPLVERMEKVRNDLPSGSQFRQNFGLSQSSPLVALLPGSRRREIEMHLQPMLDAAVLLAKVQPAEFLLALAPGYRQEEFSSRIPELLRNHLRFIPADQRFAALTHARLAFVASGTATVETALLGTPMVVIYRVAPLTYWLARGMVRTTHVAMVNLIAGKQVVPELLQSQCAPLAIAAAARPLLSDGPERSQMLAAIAHVRQLLGAPGAISRAADEIEPFLVAPRTQLQ